MSESEHSEPKAIPPHEPTPPPTSLDARVKNLELGLASVFDDKFEPNVYRRALELTIREDVYTKLRNLVWLISALATVGLGLAAKNYIDNSVTDAIRVNQSRLEDVGRLAARQLLISRLADARGRQWAPEMLERLDRQDIEILASCITEPLREHERTVAIDYAAERKVIELKPAMLSVLRDSRVPDKVRQDVFERFRRLPGAAITRDILVFAESELSTNGPLLAAGIDAVTRLNAAPSVASKLINDAARSSRREVSQAALVYLIVNPEMELPRVIDRPAFVKLHSGLLELNKLARTEHSLTDAQRGDVVSTIGAMSEDLLRSALRRIAEQGGETADNMLLSRLSVLLAAEGEQGESRDGQLSSEQVQSLGQYFAMRTLREGSTSVATWFLQDHQFDVQAWAEVRGLFRGLSEVTRSRSSENVADEEQSTLQEAIGEYRWDDDGHYVRVNRERESIEMLRRGSIVEYMNLMSEEYYSDSAWRNEVRVLFPEYRHGVELTGSHDEQDALWRWAESNRPGLRWRREEGVWRLVGGR